MGSFLKKGSLRIYDLFPALNVKHIPTDELTMIAGDKRAMINVNTPEEIEMVSRKTGIQQPQAVSFVAKSGTGKTTLLEKVIALLKGRGYRIGVIKHDAHRFEIDHPGKDSYRLTAAGADTMLISSPEKLALVKKHAASPPIEEILSCYFTDMDIVLTEGFKMSGLPKIEVHRRERSQTLLCRGEEDDPTLLAVASDEPLNIDVPVLDLNDPVMVADFIEARFLHGVV
jgi:molybdopterin-guanine dinucleotide biosynthesis protein B/molybdopterin-guanine dinucleotide biosynthesis protein